MDIAFAAQRRCAALFGAGFSRAFVFAINPSFTYLYFLNEVVLMPLNNVLSSPCKNAHIQFLWKPIYQVRISIKTSQLGAMYK